MQKCDLQVNKLIRKEFGPFSLKKVIFQFKFSWNIGAFKNYKFLNLLIES